MANAAQIVAAFRDVAATKSLSDEEMTDLVKDGILAGLARIYGTTVQAEISIDEDTGEFDIVVLRRVVEDVEDPACEVALEEARWDDETYEVGDVMEIPVAFEQFGRNAVQAVMRATSVINHPRRAERRQICHWAYQTSDLSEIEPSRSRLLAPPGWLTCRRDRETALR